MYVSGVEDYHVNTSVDTGTFSWDLFLGGGGYAGGEKG